MELLLLLLAERETTTSCCCFFYFAWKQTMKSHWPGSQKLNKEKLVDEWSCVILISQHNLKWPLYFIHQKQHLLWLRLLFLFEEINRTKKWRFLFLFSKIAKPGCRLNHEYIDLVLYQYKALFLILFWILISCLSTDILKFVH